MMSSYDICGPAAKLRTLQEEIEAIDRSNASVNHCARSGVPVLVCMCRLGRIKTSMVTLSAYDNRQLGPVAELDLSEGSLDLR